MSCKPKPTTYLAEMDELPPFKCWALARHPGRRPMRQTEIAAITGWPLAKVERLCALRSWRTVAVADADKFRIACGVTRKSERRQKFYLKRTLDLTRTAAGLSHFRKRPRTAQVKLIQLSLANRAGAS